MLVANNKPVALDGTRNPSPQPHTLYPTLCVPTARRPGRPIPPAGRTVRHTRCYTRGAQCQCVTTASTERFVVVSCRVIRKAATSHYQRTKNDRVCEDHVTRRRSLALSVFISPAAGERTDKQKIAQGIGRVVIRTGVPKPEYVV